MMEEKTKTKTHTTIHFGGFNTTRVSFNGLFTKNEPNISASFCTDEIIHKFK